MIPLYSLEFWDNNAPPDQIKYTHHTLRSHFCGCTNGWYQNVLRGPHNCFILSNIIQYSKLGCSVLTTKSDSHQSSLLTLDPNVEILIPVAVLFVGITLSLVTILKHDIILCLFTLLTIILSIVFIKGGRGKSQRHYSGQPEADPWNRRFW